MPCTQEEGTQQRITARQLATVHHEDDWDDCEALHKDYPESNEAIDATSKMLSKQKHGRKHAFLIQSKLENFKFEAFEASTCAKIFDHLRWRAREANAHGFQSKNVIDAMKNLLTTFATERTESKTNLARCA